MTADTKINLALPSSLLFSYTSLRHDVHHTTEMWAYFMEAEFETSGSEVNAFPTFLHLTT